ncbi:ATP-dependent RNA helicase ddx54 [Chytriomyces hyalinus]|nr:ATP-dependent RNA helicase ddx54 [Chytriomyces hyalinus]
MAVKKQSGGKPKGKAGAVSAKGKKGPGALGKFKKPGDRPRYEDYAANISKDKKAAKRLQGQKDAKGQNGKGQNGKGGAKGKGKYSKGSGAGGDEEGSAEVVEKEEDQFETVPADVDSDNDGWDSDVASVDGDDQELDTFEDGADDEEDEEEGNSAGFDNAKDANGDDEDDEFGQSDSDDDDAVADAVQIAKSVKNANKKHKKSGGFQSMGLSYPIYSAIIQKGYKIPTPIQRKAIPIILENRDVVAMARTGSGKTAAFLIPLMEKLKVHSAKVGARGLILTPSRELALQTLKFIKEMGKHTDLRSVMLVGGGTMDDQFAALANNPDIIIATPGRLMHLIIEMNLDLRTVEYVVFDEADRLFEMGFAEQLREIIFKLPESRQTLLFSATLPKLLVDFAKAGLTDPALIRLDVDTKISSDLQLLFFSAKAEEKDAALLYLLQTVIPSDQQTIIFVATKHVVEYVHELLSTCGISSTYIFGALDQVARTMHINKFRNGLVKILIVTDVAARGIDIPLLDNVVNYDFPGSSKVLIHRVGRVGRAGRKGMAFSLISTDELPYLLDFQMFTGRPLLYSTIFDGSDTSPEPNYTTDIIFGNLPPSALEMDREQVITRIKDNVSLQTMKQSVSNGYKMYLRTRGNAAKESYTRAKTIGGELVGVHPYLRQFAGKEEVKRASILDEIARFRPAETVFEVGKRGVKSAEALMMQARRTVLGRTIEVRRQERDDTESKTLETQKRSALKSAGFEDEASESELQSTFKNLSKDSKKRKRSDKPATFRDEEFYMSHFQKDAATEKGYALNNTVSQTTGLADNFAERATDITVDMTGDDEDGLKKKKGNLVWDKKNRRFTRPTVGADNLKRIKTDSGASIPASFKTDRFEQWQKKTRINLPRAGEQELASGADGAPNPFAKKYRYNTTTAANPKSKNFARKAAAAERQARKEGGNPGAARQALLESVAQAAPTKTAGGRGAKSELKNAAQIAKERKVKEQRRAKTGRHAGSKFSGSGKKGGGGGGGAKKGRK